MTSRWIWIFSQIARRIWFRASLFSVLAIATALVAILIRPYIPNDLPTKIGADAVDNILGIIASSMLAVTTFSLSTMVSAYSAATSNVTPRATRLVMEDTTTQNVLATFVGSFLFSLVGIIALSTGAYGESGRVVLFVVTIAVIILIVVTLLRWIDHLSRLGRVTETTERVEKVTISAMRSRRQRPYLGCQPLMCIADDVPKTAIPVFVSKIGYVQHLDTGELSMIAKNGNGRVFVRAIPGQLIDPTRPVAWFEGLKEDQEEKVRSCFSIGDTRSFDQDPRFGASVLAEIASRALSPAVNDPGTAIDVISRAMRVLAVWVEPNPDIENEILYPNVYVPPLDIADLFDDLFTPIARDGAGIVEVGLRLQKTFQTLAKFDRDRFRKNAMRHSVEALHRAELGLAFKGDKERIRLAAGAVGSEEA
ncbi:DUF2254 domain-containing protein [Pararhizobium antarcticum]|uniref:DUF2254 domain-containing protein n=1 Tax=Pararhizobium antarcticum TaxID=1798805 RepID=A0A657LVP0_9HYPH|nr:DUF2254 domain-containing protein [Pararhizobium antarcticum]OJF95676.1 hypothetical protein AX761_17195 [Rhizobium sp. 58]OJF99424.1 hypothetical protein AX760_13145 [Pararhizobium antarcticum]